jgi:hypothetical protein
MSATSTFRLLLEQLKRELPLGSKEREDVFVAVLEFIDDVSNAKMLGRLQRAVEKLSPGDPESVHLLHLVSEVRKELVKRT